MAEFYKNSDIPYNCIQDVSVNDLFNTYYILKNNSVGWS